MELQAIVVDGGNGEEGKGKANTKRPVQGASSSTGKQTIIHETSEGASSSAPSHQNGQREPTTEEETPPMGGRDELGIEQQIPSQKEDSFESLCADMERRLRERPETVVKHGVGANRPPSIFRFPSGLVGIHQNAQVPELVSIGPYHHGKPELLEFEERKWFYLRKFLDRTKLIAAGQDLKFFLEEMKGLEDDTRRAYSEEIPMSSEDFVQMMLLDGCFVVEVLRLLGSIIMRDHFNSSADPISMRPSLMTGIIMDLLRLENQLPLPVLELLYSLSSPAARTSVEYPLAKLALLVFDQVFPRPAKAIKDYKIKYGKHLLDVFRNSLLPTVPSTKISIMTPLRTAVQSMQRCLYRASAQSMQSVTQLKPSGVAFRAEKCAGSLLDIKFSRSSKPLDFGKWVLQIPPIHVNDSMSILLTNCIAMEQRHEHRSKHFTDYVSFMGCLINQPRDVTLLCCDGIMRSFPHGDRFVSNLFNALKENVDFNIQESYLSKEMADMEAYYGSHWAAMIRTYFSSPWSLISIYYASFLLLLTLFQSFMVGLSYWQQ